MASEPFVDYKPALAAVNAVSSSDLSSVEDAPLMSKSKKWRRQEKKKLVGKSMVMVNLSATLDGCDDQLLPATFRALEQELGFHPSLLGSITLAQTLCLSLLCPLWGYLADRNSRKWLLAFGTASWGVTTTLLGLVSEFWQVCVLRAMNGIFLGSVGPVSQSILADSASKKHLGYSFGLIQLCSSFGRLVGGVVTTSVALLPVGAHLRGWRVCFFAVGAASVFLGVLIVFFLDEVPRKRLPKQITEDSGGTGSQPTEEDQSWKEFMRCMLKESFSTPSVLITLAEGLVGTVPWSAFSFNTMFFQYCGMSDLEAALLTGALLIGAALGGVMGGILGDQLYEYSPNHGRPLVGQLAMIVRVPMLVVGYLIIPREETSFYLFFLLALFIGLTSMSGVAVNRPILAEVVRPDHKATVFSITVALEGSSAAILGAPLVGYLAENVFGYQRTTLLVTEMPGSLRMGNADALAFSLVALTAIPWTLSFLLYGFLHWTYGKDQQKMDRMYGNAFAYEEEAASPPSTSPSAGLAALNNSSAFYDSTFDG